MHRLRCVVALTCLAIPSIALAQQDVRDRVRSRAFLTQMTAEVNKTLPRMIDRETELVVQVALEGVIVIQNRMVNYTTSQVPQGLSQITRDLITGRVCANTDTVYLLRWGLIMRYIIFDKDYRHAFSFDVSARSCGT